MAGPSITDTAPSSPVAVEVVRPDAGVPIGSAGTSAGQRMPLGPSGEMLSCAAVTVSDLEVATDISPPPFFPSTSQHLSLNPFFFLSFLLGAPPCRHPGKRCYKQDMGSLEICKQEWLKVFNSIPAVNRDKEGSAVWSRESVSDGVALPCRLFTETGNKYFFGFCQRKISLKMC